MTEPALSLHTSNRLDVLVEHLAQTFASEPIPPLESEIVVVQSLGMVRWVSLQLARRLGIAAGITMPFPGPFCGYLADRLLDDQPDVSPASTTEDPSQPPPSLFGHELLSWRIFDLLPEIAARGATGDEASSPNIYLQEDGDQIKRYQLSVRLASLFDDYQLFRPEMLLAWESGSRAEDPTSPPSTEGWQSELWRLLTSSDRPSEEHQARRFTRLLSRLRKATRRPEGLPSRLSVFGVSTLPPLFIEVATALARFIPVRLYFTSPTYHYWGDLRSPREASSLRRRLQTTLRAPVGDHFETGNPLLAGLGRQGRDFFNLLQEADTGGEAWHELEFVDPGTDCLLHTLQSDILHLIDRGSAADPPRLLAPNDDSLRIHACHSPRREMEVLRDQLLAAFEQDAELELSDVLVMVPDIAEYSPYIEAVFGVEWQGTPSLPFAIADRYASQEQPLAESLLDILDLVASRLTPRAVLDLLDTAALRRAFRITAGDVPLLRRWIRDANIRWGMDGSQRARDFDLPAQDANSWRAGLDRLIMGYATGESQDLYANIVPQAGATAGSAELLGNLSAFVETLFKHLRGLRDPRSPEAWGIDLSAAIEALYEPENENEERGLELMREAVYALTQAGSLAGVTTDLTLTVVRAHLRRRLRTSGRGTGFISGRITFCALKPMRSIPFEVICVAGLSEGTFPRRDSRRSFDLIASSPRSGDRSVREDDRYLFLETLLSARRRLLFTYEGRSQRDNRRKAPAVVLSELLDTLDRAFFTQDGRPTRELVVVEHRLHPFHPAYYGPDDPRLFSYSQESFRASQSRDASLEPGKPLQQQRAAVFIAPTEADQDGQSREPEATAVLELDLQELTELWINPAKLYCRKVLQLNLAFGDRDIDDAEPFAVDFLDRYKINQWLLARRLAEAPDGETELDLLRGRGELPLAGLGTANYAQLESQVTQFVSTLPPHKHLDPRAIELTGDDWRLNGRLENLTDVGTLRFRCANLKAKDLLRAWIAHVVHNVWASEAGADVPLTTQVIGSDRGVRFSTLDSAREILEDLISGYRQGLISPLPIFERASQAYAQQRLSLADAKSRSRTPAIDMARRAWDGDRFPGDRADPYVALCFRDRDPLAEEPFAHWADRLWRPLLKHAEDL